MTIFIKKPLLALVGILFVVSFSVSAQTSYNFSETWNFTTGGTSYSETLTGTFITNSTPITGTNSYLITGWNNVQLSGTLSGTASVGSFGGNLNFGSYNPVTDRFWGQGGGAASATNGTAFLIFNGISNPYGYDSWQVRLTTSNSGINAADQLRAFNNGPYELLSSNNPEANTIFVSGASAASGVPEIDAALAPKVGFLLACLFLIFGRKMENTASLMIA